MTTIFNQNVKVLYLLCLIAFLTSCSEKEHANSNEISEAEITNILTEMKSLGDSQGKIIKFEMKNLKEKNYSKYFDVVDNSDKVMAFAKGQDFQKNGGPGDNYTVTCTWGSGEPVVTECGESVSCAGQATWDCLENGGCATICNAVITYVPGNIPNNLEPYNSESIEQLKSILSEIVEMSSKKDKGVSFSISRNKDDYNLNKATYLDDTSNMNNSIISSARTFQVDCYGSDGEILWQGNYYDQLSASQGILDCTDRDGGCAEICEIVARYAYIERVVDKTLIDDITLDDE